MAQAVEIAKGVKIRTALISVSDKSGVVEFAKNLAEYMNFGLKPNFRVLGPQLGKNMGLFNKCLGQLDANEVAPALDSGQAFTVDLNGEASEFNKEQVEVTIASKEGFTVSMENNVFVILDTTLNEALIHEGFAREMISRVQQLRKSNDFEMMDNIKIYYQTDDEFEAGVQAFADYIKKETLALELRLMTRSWKIMFLMIIM